MPHKHKSPSFQLYAKDCLVGTMHMTNEEFGVYMRLLLWSWDNGPISKNFDELSRLVGVQKRKFARLWKSIESKWEDDGNGRLVNRRLETQRIKQQQFRSNASESGKRGASKRWGSKPHPQEGAKVMANPISKRWGSDSIAVPVQDQELKNEDPGTNLDRISVVEVTGTPIHRNHAFCHSGLCVPQFLHDEFRNRSGLPATEADQRLFAWYPKVIAKYSNRAIGDDALVFWRAEFKAAVGSVVTQSVRGKGTNSKSSMEQALQRMVAKGDLH